MNRCAESDPPHDPTVTTFGVIRHAETVWNRERGIQGHQDSPLTPEGEMMADRWGLTLRVFHWDRILASDTGRATATARRINTRLQLPMELAEHELRHQGRVELMYRPGARWSTGLRWRGTSGRPYTPFDAKASIKVGRGVYDYEPR